MSEPFSERLLALLRRIETGETTIQALFESWEDVWAGDVDFETSDGWLLRIFNDCDDYDYIDTIITPERAVWEFDALYELELTRVWHVDEHTFVEKLKAAPVQPDSSRQFLGALAPPEEP
jgi:hypothetical protein